ncbi:3-Deoxy-D-manno-octulosonate cytidylyltransferase [Elusimicrobium minutum Pei191]|uniref:3-deoxy-manno-octulosonate cytidylyltransferase n=1 Tax=Elusimicrobium minutum (strain Pei191) TaxID=445932 RepID=KDSB_ELUMP|nr:3-deoxy-manno-octulosonate cytidylyltransferase [Elusimicrobium minutum]B2KD62.1 RecName: Full=3-deoxy-manno-octulosonate cytidylyltransferase; AltName: Full=CMP-2-keto-3-deoxyoctulosonic acid synthase; Short=CKS; Short=CMP-KDO synthase [Elusimicrobium minutum Pei191]ACC98458.1 3-Deoxy-D-manno-octulosonate cytidylyltransferase [Elusimicrobium minutum Pei191]
MGDTIIVIPARYGSTRLKAKVLEQLDGKSIVEHVWRAAKAAGEGKVLIATESPVIVEHCAKFGAQAVLTSEACQSGTDRIYEAVKNGSEDYVLNLQGDEPFVKPQTIKGVIKLLKKDSKIDIATACYPTFNDDIYKNPNAVKAVLTKDMRALYFSRSAIPYKRELTEETKKAPYYIHCGIYGYKKTALERFVNLPPSNLEKLEKLEQLRALEDGMVIKSILIEAAGPAIDTAEDLNEARKYIRNN